MYSLDEIMAQKPPMRLLSRVIEYDLEKRWLMAEVDISTESIFFDNEIEGIWSCIGLEYMAQAASCLSGIISLEARKRPGVGLIVKSKSFECFIKCFLINRTYSILIKEVFSMQDFSSFYGKILDKEQRLAAMGDLKIYCRRAAEIFQENE
jgi:predicted hotdog family 3-hydroxylacyl-ACP dehydratase